MQFEMYRLHHEHQGSHWWYTARREIVLSMLRRIITRRPDLHSPIRLIDVGCGAGGMLPWLGEFGEAFGLDPAPAAIEFARSIGIEVRQGGLPGELLPAGADRADVILLLDVLEHIDDDLAALRSLHDALRPAGVLLITVPAFQFLWGPHDVVNEHKRRYTKSQLESRLRAAGFLVDQASYFNTALFPAVAITRFFRRMLARGSATPDVGRVPAPVNRLLHHLFAAEQYILPILSLPFGVSLIATAVSLPLEDGTPCSTP